MKKIFTSRMKWVIGLAVVMAVVISISGALTKNPTLGEQVTQTLLTPVRSAVSAMTRQAERFYSYIFKYESLLAENQELRLKVAAMENEIRTTDTLQRENERLRALVDLSREHEDYDLVSAYIISWNSAGWSSSFTIAKGSDSGIEAGMCAITAQGQVVGLVTEAGRNWATVTTVLDSALEVSSSIAASGYSGIVQGAYKSGKAGMLRMDYLPTDAVIRNNDQVVTTGSTLYPRDLIVGYVVDADFDETGVAKYATVSPAADFDNMEQVFIITSYVNE